MRHHTAYLPIKQLRAQHTVPNRRPTFSRIRIQLHLYSKFTSIWRSQYLNWSIYFKSTGELIIIFVSMGPTINTNQKAFGDHTNERTIARATDATHEFIILHFARLWRRWPIWHLGVFYTESYRGTEVHVQCTAHTHTQPCAIDLSPRSLYYALCGASTIWH